MKNSEHGEQTALFQWVKLLSGKYPDLELMYAVPNGGKRNIVTAMKLKAEGVKAGVPDIHLPVSKGGYHGLWIEMKVKGNKATEKQKWWHEQLRENGHKVCVCYSFEEAKEAVERYIWG